MPRKKKLNKFNILTVKQGESSSRFLVDLKEKARQEEIKKEESRPKLPKIAKAYKKKLPELRKFFIKTKNAKPEPEFKKLEPEELELTAKEHVAAQHHIKHQPHHAIKKSQEKKEKIKITANFKERAKNLAFLNLIFLVYFFVRAIWRIFYKICHAIGWVTVFFARLFYFTVVKLVSPIVSFYKAIKFIVSHVALFLRLNIGRIVSIFSFVSPLFKINLPPAEEDASRLKKIERKYEDNALNTLRNIKLRKGWSFRKILPQPKTHHLFPAMFFGTVLLVLVVPLKAFTYYKSLDFNDLKARVVGASEEAAGDLMSASKAASGFDLTEAKKNFSEAGSNFLKAQDDLNEINGLIFTLASFSSDKKVRLAANAKNILAAGKLTSDLGGNLAAAIDSFSKENNKGRSLVEIIDAFLDNGSKAAKNAEDLRSELGMIDMDNIPEEYRSNFSLLLDKTQMLGQSLREFIGIITKMKIFLGLEQDKRYLFVFQNNTELRATGGFIGSFAIVDFREGRIKNIEVPQGGSYDTEAGLLKRIEAPAPLHLVNPLWHFWDANWWPDWPTSARKLEWFYEKSDGSTVDGVISLTPSVIEKILKVVGPIDMTKDYGAVIDADNFWIVTQRFSEQKPDVTKKPKKIIGDLMAKMLEEIPKRLDQEKILGLLKAIEESFDGKQILLYFNDPELESMVDDLGWSGKIEDTKGDYLAVINTNIAGGKSDRKIKEKISHLAEINSDGSVIDTVKIERAHTAIKGEEFTGVRNVDWIRVYVPLGSELIEASGFRKPEESLFGKIEGKFEKDGDVSREEKSAVIDEKSGTKIYVENSHTVFANWSMADPGEIATLYFKYKLPFKVEKSVNNSDSFVEKAKAALGYGEKDLYPFSLLVQKQAGAAASDIESTLKTDGKLKVVWRYPKGLSTESDGWGIADSLDRDKYWAVLLENN